MAWGAYCSTSKVATNPREAFSSLKQGQPLMVKLGAEVDAFGSVDIFAHQDII
jgi:hypothetical protein